MYAVIEDSGSQFRVGKGDVIKVDRRDLDESQTNVEFDRVLMVGGDDSPKIGTPYVDNAKVTAEVVSEERTEKVTGIKFKRRKNYRRKVGHRQPILKVKITDIQS
jgi:large subunit ribosomal protein L21